MNHAEKRAQALVEPYQQPRPSAIVHLKRLVGPSTLVGCNTCASIGMGGCALILRDLLDLPGRGPISEAMNATAQAILPTAFLSAAEQASPTTISAFFILSIFLFSATLFGFLIDTHVDAPSEKVSWIRITIVGCLWILAGATVEELLLVFLPGTISLDMIVNLVMEKRKHSG